MYKRIIFFLIVFGCIIGQSNAQELSKKVEEAKWNVIRSAISFLVADTSTFKNIKKPICTDCNTYEQAKKFIEINRLVGLEKLLLDWRKFKVNTLDTRYAEKDFVGFRGAVLKDISRGSYIKTKEREVAFAEFKDRIDGILIFPKKAEGQSTAEQSSEDPNPKNKDSNSVETEFSWFSNENIVYYELTIIICLLIFLLFKVARSKKERRKYLRLKDKLYQAEIERDVIQDSRDTLSKEINELKTKILDLENQLGTTKTIETLIEPEQDKSIVKEWEVSNQIPVEKIPEVFYTKYADLIDGFSPSEFVKEENNESIFEITIQSANKATYSISENANAQRYALTNADYFLRKTCRYDVVPFGRIVTNKPGQLSLMGGKWRITEQAEISFK